MIIKNRTDFSNVLNLQDFFKILADMPSMIIYMYVFMYILHIIHIMYVFAFCGISNSLYLTLPFLPGHISMNVECIEHICIVANFVIFLHV